MTDDTTTDEPVEGEDGPGPLDEFLNRVADGSPMIAAERVAGDLLEALLNEIALLESPWQAMTKNKQDDVIERLRKRVTAGLKQACYVIASQDNPAANMTLKGLRIGERVTAQLVGDVKGESLGELAEYVGDSVLVVCAEPDEFMAGINDATGREDQEEMEV